MRKILLLDPYVKRARLQPGLIVALPVALAVLAWFQSEAAAAGAVWSLVVWSGGTALVAQMARDRGRAKEPQLFERWGGRPTARLLRHRDSANRMLLEHRHRKLAGLLPNVHIPSADEEASDPQTADAAYDVCVAFLREKTRSRENFPIVFEANCDYGLRRNLWGMKPFAIVLAFGSAVAIAFRIYLDITAGLRPEPAGVAAAIAVVALLVAWIGWFSAAWVKTTADAYAERLLGALENL